tara:strand:+ start:3045 stop:10133 length:7089 start_codon:yes stop_codon:yes gene_type:complete
MPEIKKTFLRGRMNKDLDERLIPEGEYRDASNIQISSSESSDTGSVQNILGNRYANATLDSNGLPSVTSYTETYGLGGKCIGSIANEETNKLYLFIKGTSTNAIIEFNSTDKTSIPVLVDVRSNKVLNFTDDKITGITILQNFLIFTDNNSEPKILDISDNSIFKLSTSHKVGGKPIYNQTTRINQHDGSTAPFVESDITLIKKKPHNAPRLILESTATNVVATPSIAANVAVTNKTNIYEEKFVRFAYRWKFTNNQYSVFSPFSEPVFFPSSTNDFDIDGGLNNQMSNNLTKASLVNLECGNGLNSTDIVNNIKSIDIIYKESRNTNTYLYKTIKYSDFINNSLFSAGIEVTKESKKSILPDTQLFRAYDNVPYAAKALDVVGNRLVFGNYKDGIELEGYIPTFHSINTSTRSYVEDEVSRKYFGASNIATTGFLGATNDTIKDMSTIKSGRNYQIGLVFEDEYGRQTPVVTDETGFKTVEFDTGFNSSSFGLKFDITMSGLPPGVQKIIGNGTVKDFDLTFLNKPESINDFKVFFGAGASAVEKIPTTDYTYNSNTGTVTFVSAPSANTIVIFDRNQIKRFKYYIKQNSEQYYNFAVEEVRSNNEDSTTVWLVVPSYEINKIQKGDRIILKKQLNTNQPINYALDTDGSTATEVSDYKFRILEISNNKPANIDSPESYPDKFFIKVKKKNSITKRITSSQGSGGIDTRINRDDFVILPFGSSSPSNSLFLGQTITPQYEDHEHTEYYFKDGRVYELVKKHDVSTTIYNTFDTSNNSGNTSGLTFNTTKDSVANFANLPDDIKKSNWAGAYTDSTGTIVDIFVTVDSHDFATNFFIGYASNTAQHGSDGNDIVPNSSPAIFETIPKENKELDIYYETSQSFPISQYGEMSSGEITEPELEHQVLNFTNAFLLSNGVESNRIEDDFNQHVLEPGVRVSTTINQDYNKRNQKSGLIYSGIYNSTSNLNSLNEFNTAIKITKDLNPEYGSIQKLHTRNTDIIAFCEDKVIRVLANKDALFNADGNVNVTSNENVLGQAIAYNGEYGISKNPESFAEYGYISYFTDKARGVVLRLSQNGIEVISSKAMTSYFRENLTLESGNILGSFDIYSKQYILSLPNTGSSISFKENVDGWVSRLSFLPDSAVSVNGKYYTCYNSELYEHNIPSVNRNNFYGIQHTSGLKFIFNQEPSAVKNFQTIGYEGTTGWLSNLNGVDVIITDQQTGEVVDFIEKEGKYFANISGVEEELNTLSGVELDSKLKNFSIQGLGNIANHSGVPFTTTTTTTTSTTTTTTSTTTSTTTLDTSFSLSVSGYSNGGCTLTGTFGSSYTDSDAITLKVNSGNIGITNAGNDNDVDTTKSLLAGTLTLKLNEAVTITATVTSGLGAGTVATIVAPQSTAQVINGPATAFTYDNVTLTAETTGSITSYQWHKGTSSGFTVNTASAITGATNSTLTTTETTADTIYYVVRINDSANSAEHNIVWSARTSFTARYQSGIEAVQTACAASGTTINIFANNTSFTAATKFFTDVEGNTDNFQQGTYSNSTDGSDNHYRFINSNGIPGGEIACSTNSAIQPITVTACRNSSVVKNFNVSKSTSVADLVINKVIDFTTTDSSGFTHWVVTNANYTGESFDGTPTLANVNNADTCIAQDPPTLAITATGSVVRGQTITLTATPSHSSQGGTYSYQFQRSTDDFASNSSSVGGAISGTAAAKSTTTTESTADSLHFRCVLNGSITSNKAAVIVSDYQSVSLKRTAGTDIEAKTTACNSTDLVTLYYNQLVSNLSGSTVLYTDAAGATGTITAGTYSDGTHYAYVNASRSVLEKTVDGTTARWHVCTGTAQTITISGSATGKTTEAVQLTATAANYTPTTFTWERKVSGGSYSTSQTGSDSVFYASESSAGAYVYKVTAVDEAGVSKTDEHTVTFSVPTQTVTVQACPGGGTSYNIKITNADSFAVGNVVQLAQFEGGNAGSYKITNASAGSFDDTTTATNTSAFADCCSAIGCSASISMTVGGSASTSGAIALGSTVILTAAASGYTAGGYSWQVSTNNGTSYGDVVGTSASFTPVNTDAGSKLYKCTVAGSQGESEFATKSISWFASSPVERTYNLLACNDDFLALGTYTSVDPLPNNTVVDIGTGICFQTGTYFEGASQPTANGAISLGTVQGGSYGSGTSGCTTCNSAQTRTDDCTASFNSGSYSSGSYTLTGFFGTSYSDSDEFTLSSNNGTATVSGSNIVTVSALKAGATVTVVAGSTITLSPRLGANCAGITTHTTIVPLDTCNGVSVFYTNDNPQSSTTAANQLCGGGTLRAKTAYMNGTTLATSQVIYSNFTCSNLLGGTKYFSEDNSNYYIWNGYTLAGPYNVHCP